MDDRALKMLLAGKQLEIDKLKPVIVKNTKATQAWYAWQKRTGRQCIPGDFIAGHVAIIKKVNNDRQRSNEAA